MAIDTGLEDLKFKKRSTAARVEMAVCRQEARCIHVGNLDGLRDQRMALEIYKEASENFSILFKEIVNKIDGEGGEVKDE